LIFGDSWYNGCPNTIRWSKNLEFSSLINKRVSNKNEIIDFLKLKLKNESVLGILNSNLELRFKNFVSENFNNLQLQGIYDLLKEILTSKI